MKEQKIRAVFVFEMLGRPPEHLKQTLEEFVNKLETIQGIKIEGKTIHNAKPIEKKEGEKIEDLFTTFAEVEILADNFNALSLIIFNMLPAHVDIIEPSDLNFSNFDLSNLLSELTVKLHKYDEVAKRLVIERNIVMRRLEEADKKIQELGGESILKKQDKN